MNKMIAVILMAAGFIMFTVGLLKYLNKSDSRVEVQTIVSAENHDTIVVLNEQQVSTSQTQSEDNELQSVVSMAIADGVLTQNEKDTLRNIATAKKYDYNQLISKIEQELKKGNIKAETEVIDQDKKKGTDFEKYVVEKFNKKYFKIKEWAGDKYVNGRYAETTLQPDLKISFSHNNQKRNFAVECKYRSSFYQDGVVVASDEQLARYKKFEDQENTTVYLAIGVGGTATAPSSLYVVPLSSINSSFISFSQLKKHFKNPEKNFFYDLEKEHLN